MTTFNSSNVVTIDFLEDTGIKRRPGVVLLLTGTYCPCVNLGNLGAVILLIITSSVLFGR